MPHRNSLDIDIFRNVCTSVMQGMQFDVLSDIVEFVCRNMDTTDNMIIELLQTYSIIFLESCIKKTVWYKKVTMC